jgi:predicted nucleic acid-binding protein
MTVVVDASTTLGWLFGELESIDSIKVRAATDSFVVPPIWQLEISNAVLKRERQRRITTSDAATYFELLDALSFTVVAPEWESMEEIAIFARPYQLTSYDACYLRVAMQLSVGLMTQDQNLRDAAARLNVDVIG